MSNLKKVKGVPRDHSAFSTLEEFLAEEGILEEVTASAIKRAIAHDLRAAMEENNISKVAMAARMGTSRRQLDRVLDPEEHENVTIETLTRAARAVGRQLKIELA